MKVLVITTVEDAHVDYVRDRTPGDFVILDPNRFLADFDLTFTECNGVFTPESTTVDLSEIDVVWHRKPWFKRDTEMLPIQKKYRKMVRSAYYNFVTGIYGILTDKLWVSDWWSIKKAESKLFQLETAHKVGMMIPKTIVTNNSDKAQQFLDQYQPIVMKSLSDELVEEHGDSWALFTSRVDPDESFEGLDINPSIFQHEIVGGTDIRVTVVGNEVFPAQIIKLHDLAHTSDWRLGIGTDDFLIEDDGDFPVSLRRKCVALVQRLGLRYGAIDFIRDSEGQYWFLEINPNGQWLFVEEMSGLPISGAFTRLFQTAV